MVGFKRFNSQIFACGFLLLLNFNEIFGDTSADSWFMFARETTKVLKTCYQSDMEFADSWRCVKYNSLLLFDDVTSNDRIPMNNYIEFVRTSLVVGNETWPCPCPDAPAPRKYEVFAPKRFFWLRELSSRIYNVLSTHSLRFVVNEPEVTEGRRRHRQRMFPIMVFGMAVLGVIIVPIGFHIMTVIGGTALLFAKMALLIASVTGSKRLVPHGAHLGAYHDHYYGHYGPLDRYSEPQPQVYRQ